MATEGQAVRFRDCTCPGTPHNGRDGADDGDIVYMREYLGFAAGAEALRKIAESGGNAALIAELVGPVYIREGPERWNLVNAAGLPIPMTKAALEALPYHEAYSIVEKADDLYTLVVMSPLAQRMNGRSGNGLTAKPTPRKRRSSAIPPSPPQSSSHNGSDGKPSVVSQ